MDETLKAALLLLAADWRGRHSGTYAFDLAESAFETGKEQAYETAADDLESLVARS